MEETAARHAAETLLAEHKSNTMFKPFDRPQGPATISDAYDIQDRFVGLLRAEHGDSIGYKVGLTSETMQKFCGIDHPIAGVVLSNRLHRSGATIRRADFGRLGLEFEIAVRVKTDLPPSATPLSVEAIAPYIAGVCAAIELVDDRAADYTSLDMLALVSDNSWNGGIVLSELVTNWPDLESVLGKATRDGAAIGEGHGRDILGHPFNSVAWLAAHLSARGGGLKAGQIVMTGSVMKTVFPTEEASYAFSLENIGSVSVIVR
jgi:2-keto-4-pentenoate hydratase